ncbi:hypothetical protein P4H66_08695 [Paenibacillus dokdonensis]|uniref:Uncharacterized protein n=1 Tax=Paenibacillus dokdonensis TaxID=2567944 RepID=A0ABU6GJL0_9BACL|nr:hypothetical protein [Paenibacillus dokdonensis]MEC0239926.1 hypothetical protein [Paenibacillus dokdonensis]
MEGSASRKPQESTVISFDFWPIGWDRAERMATSEDWMTTIIADCELLYVRSEDNLARFMELRETISNMGNESNAFAFISKAVVDVFAVADIVVKHIKTHFVCPICWAHGELHRYGSLYKVYLCWQWTTLRIDIILRWEVIAS